MLCEQFSAMHSQPPSSPRSGKKKFISAGASVSGVIWNTIRTPSTIELLAGVGDVLGRSEQPRRRQRDRLAEPAVDVLLRAGGQQRPELVHRPTRHREPGDHVLGDRLAEEVLRGDDPASSGVDVVLAGHTEHSAEVVGVGVGVDHRHDRSLAERVVGQLQAVACTSLDGEWVDDDPSGVALDEGDVGDVVAAGLPDLRCHLEEAVDVVELGLPPQARVDRVGVGRSLLDEVVLADVPSDAPGPLDHAGRVLRDQPPGGPLEVVGIHPEVAWSVDRPGVIGGLFRKRRHATVWRPASGATHPDHDPSSEPPHDACVFADHSRGSSR